MLSCDIRVIAYGLITFDYHYEFMRKKEGFPVLLLSL